MTQKKRLSPSKTAPKQTRDRPKHEHKQAGVAYLASLWFERPDGEPVKKKQAA